MTKKRNLQEIISKANSFVNADIQDLEGLRRHLTAWYCFTFNTTFKDPVFLSHTLEELLLLYFMFDIKNRPAAYRHITEKEQIENYENWLKKQMGEDYLSEDAMVHQIEAFEKKERDLAASLPDVITTDLQNPDSKNK